MKHHTILLLWITTASFVCGEPEKITVKSQPNGIMVTCPGQMKFIDTDLAQKNLDYLDGNSGEYTCVDAADYSETASIYVKFRSCDNCVELDIVSLTGIALGNVVATVAIGVAVYLTVSHSRTSLNSSHRKSSDRQHLVPNEVRNRSTNDHYQPLNHKGGQKDMYDVLTNRR